MAIALGGKDSSDTNDDTSSPTISQEASQDTAPSAEEKVLYEKDGLKITFKSLNTKDSLMGPELKLLIENNTSTSYTVQVRDFSVNGFMVTPIFSPEVGAGKKVNAQITMMSNTLEENAITKIENVEFTFLIIETDSFTTTTESGKISIAFQ